ncbi:carboxy-terminal domain RNA polymerase II polypeptide A small phosphatase [Catalinimonas alkaloidigena]|uniref:Carboxy-terminal domain RNA polymerase II polypeptide A small phosphatase n=1 Tax=Catalinimonas alkaloidigena TaxID=1075417 RepID=A0A1G9SIX6_9BACT|nr:HAD family hydrolase [Catalinimonas alkaloidigena]SDM35379.1 carboxy-terminal domain RNA polymerase II polypeptide A small phosphatase [Catalinimonas alkaloidigena]
MAHVTSRRYDTDKLLVILDLDETLIFATSTPHDTAWHFEAGPYKVYRRPHAAAFLATLAAHFEVAVWSSASDDYVAQVVAQLFPAHYPLRFVWGRSRCTFQIDYEQLEETGSYDPFSHYHYVKKLRKVRKRLGIPLERMLIVDDTPYKCRYNYGNAIYVKEFWGDPADEELRHLTHYLLSLRSEPNVRTLEKRFWRAHYQ